MAPNLTFWIPKESLTEPSKSWEGMPGLATQILGFSLSPEN